MHIIYIMLFILAAYMYVLLLPSTCSIAKFEDDRKQQWEKGKEKYDEMIKQTLLGTSPFIPSLLIYEFEFTSILFSLASKNQNRHEKIINFHHLKQKSKTDS